MINKKKWQCYVIIVVIGLYAKCPESIGTVKWCPAGCICVKRAIKKKWVIVRRANSTPTHNKNPTIKDPDTS